MRILRVSHSAVVRAWRGRERALRDRGHDVALVCARAWDAGGHRVPLEPDPGEDVVGARTLGTHPALFLYDPRPLWRALGRPHDVLDLHEEPFALATTEVLALRAARRAWDRLRGVARRPAPYLVYSAQNIEKRYPWPFGALERRVLAGAAGAHVCNDEAGRILRRKGLRGPAVTVPLGVDAPGRITPAGSTLAVEPTPPVEPVETHRPVVGYAGRLAPHKGVAVAVRAVLADERLELRIAGAGPQEAELRALAAPAGDRIAFLGPLRGAELTAFYGGLDVLAVPSLDQPGWREQFGRVAVEAMACGVPVVASDCGALPDVVADAGIVVPQGDVAALGAALRRVVNHPAMAADLRTRGLAVAERCSWPQVAQAYEGLYRQATGTPRTNPGLEVVVVAYGAPEALAAALAPVAGVWPTTVVDNSSRADVRAVVEHAGARYLDPGHNGGFASGVNHALAHRQVPGADVLLLNPDAVVAPADVAELHRALLADPGLASVGPRQSDDHGHAARVAWPFPTPVRAWLEAVGLGRLPAPARRTFVIGSVLLLRAAALADVGAFDERFFLYAEETDWAYRAARRGWRHAVVASASALHAGAGTSSDPRVREAHFHGSQERYYRKHYGPVGWAAARVAVVAGSAARTTVPGSSTRRDAARRRLRIYVAGPARASAALLEGRR